MTQNKHRTPDPEVVAIIARQINSLIQKSIEDKVAMSNEILVATICHFYENKEFILVEAGMDAPVAAKKDLEIDLICADIDKIRGFAWNGDTDPHQGIMLAESAAPFFRKYGVKIKKLLKGAE